MWLDCNANGVQDAEAGVAGVTVKLLDGSGTVVETQTTDANGNYLFDALTPGSYSLNFVAPTGYTFTTKDQGSDALDSDVDSSGKTIQTVLTAGESDLTWDAGPKVRSQVPDLRLQRQHGNRRHRWNIRSYTVEGVKVNVSAFAEDTSTMRGARPTLVPTAAALASPTAVRARDPATCTRSTTSVVTICAFEFSQQVVVDKAYLGYVVKDSDVQVWIGTVSDPISSHLNLNSSVLSSLGFTRLNQTTSSSARWADFNAGEVTGNVLVIAADTTDTSPEDRFKIAKLAVYTTDPCDPVTPPPVEAACAKIVGATSINEGSKASYMVQLDKAVDEDVVQDPDAGWQRASCRSTGVQPGHHLGWLLRLHRQGWSPRGHQQGAERPQRVRRRPRCGRPEGCVMGLHRLQGRCHPGGWRGDGAGESR